MARRIITNDRGNRYAVADEGDLPPSWLKENGGYYEKAPEPWRSKIAARWYTWPFNQEPWLGFPISDDEVEDEKWKQYQQVVGVLPQRMEFVQQGGRREDYSVAAGNYMQDFGLFMGIVDPPPEIQEKITKANPEFVKYGLGEAQAYVSITGGPPAPTVNLFFPDAKIPPKAGGQRGIFQWVYENVERTFNVPIIVCAYQEIMLDAGFDVPARHPALPPSVGMR